MIEPVGEAGTRQFRTAAGGIAAEQALLQAARDGQFGRLIWTARQPGLVAPAALARRPEFEQAAKKSAARGWPVHMRATGGGIAPQGPGVVSVAFAGPADGLSTEAVYRWLCAAASEALAALGISTETAPLPGSFCDGRWNLLCGGRKIMGTAQRWSPRKAPQSGWAFLADAVILEDMLIAAPIAAIDKLSANLGLPPTAGPAVHTTVASERAVGCLLNLGPELTSVMQRTFAPL